MLSLLYLGAIAVAFLATMVPVLLLGALGWALSKSHLLAMLMGAVMLAASGAIVYAMNYTLRGTDGGLREAAKVIAGAMSPALFLSLLFAAVLFRAAR